MPGMFPFDTFESAAYVAFRKSGGRMDKPKTPPRPTHCSWDDCSAEPVSGSDVCEEHAAAEAEYWDRIDRLRDAEEQHRIDERRGH